MARARDRLRERYEGGYALGVTEAGTTLRFGGEGERFTPPSAASVAGYKRQREGALALKARQQTTRMRRAQGPETPAQVLARTLGIDEDAAYLAVRHPGLREFVSAKLRHGRRMTEIDRMQTGRMEVKKFGAKTSRELLGERLKFGREGLGVTKDIAAARVMSQNKRALAGIVQRQAEEKGRTARAATAAEATAASAVGKRAETRRVAEETAQVAQQKEVYQRDYDRLSAHRTKLVTRAEKLEDIVLKPDSTAPDKAAAKAARKKVQGFDAKGELDKAYGVLQEWTVRPEVGGEVAGPRDETVTPAMPGGEVVTPRMAQPEAGAPTPAAQPAARPTPRMPAALPGQYQTSGAVINDIKAGLLDLNAPESGGVFDSLAPTVQEEVRAWLKRSGYLDR